MSLLGPIGPELSCDEYVEGREVHGMAAHLEGCPACREDYESLLALVRHDDGGAPTEV